MESVMRDRLFIGNDREVNLILNDMEIYFNAKELLTQKFDDSKIGSAQEQLNQVKRKSVLLDELKVNIRNYQQMQKGLKETIEKIISIDKVESVSEMDTNIQQQKLNKILNELSAYIFDYDFNFVDYPYLTDIILEVIKVKRPNQDSIVKDLLQKL